MARTCHTAIAVLLGILTSVSQASAQGAFVQAGYGTDVRRFSGEDTERVFDAAVGNVSLGVAAFLSDHVTAGIEIDLGDSATDTRTVNLSIAGRPATITTAYTLERRSVAALGGIHTSGTGRMQAGVYAGLSFSAVRREIASDAPPLVLSDPPEPSVFADRTTDALVGADVAIRVARRVALVGGVRAQGLTLTGELRGFSIRPRAGVRVLF